MADQDYDDADCDTAEALLSMFMGRHLSRTDAEDRKQARRGLIREIDRETEGWVIGGCDA